MRQLALKLGICRRRGIEPAAVSQLPARLAVLQNYQCNVCRIALGALPVQRGSSTRFVCAGKSRHVDHRGGAELRNLKLSRNIMNVLDMTDDELAAIASGVNLHLVK